MKKDFDILELISDDRKLKKFSNEELVDLKHKYPYSNIIELAINRNQFLNSGNLSLLQITDFIRKTDNPGNAFVAVVRDEVEKTKVKSTKAKVKSTKLRQSRNPELASGTKVESKKIKDKSKKSKVKSDKTKGENTNDKLKVKSKKTKVQSNSKKKVTDQTIKKVKNDEKKRVISDLSQGIASEQLANIYLKQGMIEEAIEMYRRLSLQKSKKSVYFAEILEKLINK